MSNSNQQNLSRNGTQSSASTAAITPEMIRQVTNKVYAMWLKDLRIEKERQRMRAGRYRHRQ